MLAPDLERRRFASARDSGVVPNPPAPDPTVPSLARSQITSGTSFRIVVFSRFSLVLALHASRQ